MSAEGKLLGEYQLLFVDGHHNHFEVHSTRPTETAGGKIASGWPRVSRENDGIRVEREDGSWSFAPYTALVSIDWVPA